MSMPTYKTRKTKWISNKNSTCECDNCGGTGDVSGEYPGVACGKCNGTGSIHLWKLHPIAGDGQICCCCGKQNIDCDD